MGKNSPISLILAMLCVIFGLFLLNGGIVIFGLLVLATGVFLSYKALPKKNG